MAMTSVIDFRGCFDSQDGVFLRSREVHSVQTQVLPGMEEEEPETRLRHCTQLAGCEKVWAGHCPPTRPPTTNLHFLKVPSAK